MALDQVMYVPGQFHKGILYNHPAGHDELHVWPLQNDPGWGPDPDAHPYHDEYGRDFKLQVPHDYDTPKKTQTRFYIDQKGQVRTYPKQAFNEGTPYINHTPEYLMQRVNEHIPDAQFTNKAQPIPYDTPGGEHMDWVSHTAAVNAQVINVPATVGMWHSSDQPYLYHTLTGRLFLGPEGSYHDALRSHGAEEYHDWADQVDYDNHDFSWLRGRYAPGEGVEHYDAYGIPNERTAEMLQPHFDAIENALNSQARPQDDFDWLTDVKLSAVQEDTGELHIALDVPERIRLQIARWVESLDLPRESLVNPMEYHITVAYAGEGVEKITTHELRNNFNMTGLKFTGLRLTSFEGDALVIELENPYFSEWAEKLADYLEDRGVDVERYEGGPKPHITIAYGVEKSAPLPPISFRCGRLSISTPRDASQDSLAPYMATNLQPSNQKVPEPEPTPVVRLSAGPKIVEVPGTPSSSNPVEWMNERQPFLYNKAQHSIHVGPMGTHHGDLYKAVQDPYTNPGDLYEGMMFHNPETGQEVGTSGVYWWRDPGMGLSDTVAEALHKAYPTTQWGEYTPDEPIEEDWDDDDYLQLNSHTSAGSPPATPPPWQPGTWGKGLFIDHPDGPQLSAWTTGTPSLNGGRPHHNQVAEGHHGMSWPDMIDGMRNGSVYLLKVEPSGEAYECARGMVLPPSFDALAKAQGLRRSGAEEEEEYDWHESAVEEFEEEEDEGEEIELEPPAPVIALPEVDAKLSRLAELVAEVANRPVVTHDPPERRRLIVRRDDLGRISSIEEST